MRAARSRFTLAIFCLWVISLFGTNFDVKAQSPDVTTIYIYYSHLNSYKAAPGQIVSVGDIIGGAGDTGYMARKNVHLHLAFGIYPPDVQADRIYRHISQNTDWLDPGKVLEAYGYSYQPGTTVCGAPFGANNPAGGQAFHNATDHCGYSRDDPVTAVMPGKIIWTAWWPPSMEKNDTGHGQVEVEQVDLKQPLKSSNEVPYVIKKYEDLGEFVIDAPAPVPIPKTPSSIPIIVVGLLVFGGAMLIISVINKKTIIVIMICVILGFVGYQVYITSQGIPKSPIFVGTGGSQMEYVWDDPALDKITSVEQKNSGISYTSGNQLSPVFWKFAVGAKWGNDIPVWSAKQNLDPNITATFILVESGGNMDAHCPNDPLGYNPLKDPARDHGIFQLNPGYFENSCNHEENIRQGIEYIKSRMDAANGNLAAAAAGYNGGPMALKWFLISSNARSFEYLNARNDYIQFLNNNGYDGPSKAGVVEIYVKRILGVYNAAKSNTTQGLEPFMAQGSYAGSVAKAYGLPWPPNP